METTKQQTMFDAQGAQNAQDAQKPKQQSVIKRMENISEQVLQKINKLQEVGDLILPKNYSVENNLKAAWLILQEVEDRDHHKALEVCTKDSIANSLLDMVIQGLSVSKKQGYFIVYGKQLQFQRSYFGTTAIAKRVGGISREPVAHCIYEGDEFVYMIDPATGLIKIVKHEQKLENIDNTKIKGAYTVLTRPDGTTEVTVMSWAQIQKAWGQGATKGNSPAHKNFAEEMAKKTVIGRACKSMINSSDDAWLYDGMHDNDAEGSRNEVIKEQANSKSLENFENAEYEEITTVQETPSATAKEPSTQTEAPQTDEPPF